MLQAFIRADSPAQGARLITYLIVYVILADIRQMTKGQLMRVAMRLRRGATAWWHRANRGEGCENPGRRGREPPG
jgi:hypothetical protein